MKANAYLSMQLRRELVYDAPQLLSPGPHVQAHHNFLLGGLEVHNYKGSKMVCKERYGLLLLVVRLLTGRLPAGPSESISYTCWTDSEEQLKREADLHKWCGC